MAGTGPMGGIGTTSGARAHARAQGGTVVACMPTVPARATAADDLPDGVAAHDVIWAETVAGGNYTSKVLARGTVLRLTDLDNDACASVLVFSADQPWERLNVADTVKVLWQAYLTEGHLLLSDQGRVLASIASDTSGFHDALAGTSSRLRNESRYGDGTPQGASPAGRELFALAALKHGLDRRDVGPSISFFKGYQVDAHGALLATGSAGAGASIELRMEMPAIVLVVNAPHPLDARASYTCTPCRLVAYRGRATGPGDALWTHTPEGERAFLNTADYLEARGIA